MTTADDGYRPTPLPDFIQVAMGLRAPRGTPPKPPDPAAARPVVPRRVAPAITAVLPPERGGNQRKPQPKPKPESRATRDQRLDRLSRQTVTAVLAIPVWIIVAALLYGLLAGPDDERTVIVNDDPSCESGPITLAPSELATREYWKEC